MADHVTLEQIADVYADNAVNQDARVVRAHIEHCRACAVLAQQVTDVSQVLAAAPTPDIPADVSVAVQSAIAAEAARRAALKRTTGSQPRVAPAPSRRSTSQPKGHFSTYGS